MHTPAQIKTSFLENITSNQCETWLSPIDIQRISEAIDGTRAEVHVSFEELEEFNRLVDLAIADKFQIAGKILN